jgi:hypothetical protein
MWDGNYRYATSPNAITLNEWHHLVGVADGSSVRIYVDGILKDSQPAGASWGGGSKFILSYRKSAVHEYYNGDLDQLRIYNRALTTNEVADLYLSDRLVLATEGKVRFTEGIRYTQALGDLSMGIYTNAP